MLVLVSDARIVTVCVTHIQSMCPSVCSVRVDKKVTLAKTCLLAETHKTLLSERKRERDFRR